MKTLKLILSIMVAAYTTGIGQYGLAQETGASPFSITLSPVQWADVKGNAAKFRAVNWMKDGYDGGISDITFIKQINKDVSLDLEGSLFPKTQNYDDELVLKDADLSFLKISYKSFRKYFDGTGGIDRDFVNSSNGTRFNSTGPETPVNFNALAPNSPDLQMDIRYFKLEAGLGPITDPFLDVSYEHNTKDGYKSLLSWGAAYNSNATARYRYITPSWGPVNDTADVITLKEKKDFAGVTLKAEQKAEVDYNHNKTISVNSWTTAPVGGAILTSISQRTTEEYLDAKIFGSGVRLEKWMLNDNTFAALGYHFNHIRNTDLMQNVEYDYAGVVYNTSRYSHQSAWSPSRAMENEHVWVGNFNSNLTPDLAFITDAKYQHVGSEGSSTYMDYSNGTSAGAPGSIFPAYSAMERHQDNTGEHIALRYSGIPHTSLYVESDLQQQRNWYDLNYQSTASPSGNFVLDRIARGVNESWDMGGKIVPNRFFTFTTQFKQHWDSTRYSTVVDTNPGSDTFLDSLKKNGHEVSATLGWKPYRFLQNSFRYQLIDTIYNPRAAAEGNTASVASYPISKNSELMSVYTYDITLEPIDPLMLMLSYSHVENYVRSLAAYQPGLSGSSGSNYFPSFNSGSNTWVFSTSYAPTEKLLLTNTVSYTISPNYVDFADGIPYGSSFKELDITAGLEYTYHKWLKIGPKYRHASYRGNPLVDAGTYSANIYSLDLSFNW